MIDKLDNRYRVTGRMLIADARSLLEAGRALLLGESDKDVLLDLAAVEDADSSALGVIFGLIRTADARGVRIRLVNLPAGLVSIASLYGVSESLPLA